ncbi:dynamin family protein [Actinomadura sp. NBRC 104425]|uniref:dynamin family protein n=1 Tax=Actinomadura sp. NBRC 104425 TaxID=3032204 RepID=UPI0025527728|nr:dynamin family protein [Actinomadura sp. NBRC 104425]
MAEELEQAIRPDQRAAHSAVLGQAAQELDRESFRVMVFGDFSSGKSTLINALLGEDGLLPTKENPTTAFTTVLRWGEVRRAELYRGDLDDRGQDPERVTVEEFQNQVALRIDESGEPVESPYSGAVVYLPFELLRSGVELIDSAGTNESAARERATLQLLPRVDAIIFVTPARGGFKMHDQEHYLDMLRKLGHDDIFFVVNQFDLIRERDRREVRLRCGHMVLKMGGRTDRRLFFVSALDALEAADDAERERSGVPALMRELSDFCLHERSRIKLLRPAEALRRQVRELRKRMADRRKMLTRDADQLQTGLNAAHETRGQLQWTLERIDEVLRSWAEETEQQLAETFEQHIRELVAEVPSWPLPGRPKTHLTGQSRTDRRRAAVQQIDDALERRLQQEIHTYVADENGLAKFLYDRVAMLDSTLSPLLKSYGAGMTELRSALTGAVVLDSDVALPDLTGLLNLRLSAEVYSKTAPVLSWGTAGVGALTSAGAVALGGTGVALPVVAMIAAIAMPIGLIALGGVVPFLRSKLKDRQLRDDRVAVFQEAMNSRAGEMARAYAAHYVDLLRASISGIHDKLQDELEGTISEAEKIIEDRRNGLIEAEDEQRKLDSWEDSFLAIEEKVNALVQVVLSDMR